MREGVLDDVTKPGRARASIRELADHLRDRIRQGVFVPGQRLIEADLTLELGVGRGRVREVLRTLVGEGLLDFQENRGVLVRRLTRSEVAEIGQTREALEGLCARLAASRDLEPADAERLKALQAELDAAASVADLARYNQANRDYHHLIAELAGNRFANEFLGRIAAASVRLQFAAALNSARMLGGNADHHMITTAILGGNPDVAEVAMRAHVRRGNAHLAELADHLYGSAPDESASGGRPDASRPAPR